MPVLGRSVNLVDIGVGPPLVLVHGLGGCWGNWLENIPELARSQRVIALDLPGFGRSEMPAEPISMPGYARLLDALLTALAIESAAVVGNSMGGLIAAELAISHPARVERLVLVSAAGLSTAELGATDPRLVLGALLGRLSADGAQRRAPQLVRRPGIRKALLAAVARHGDRLSPELAYEVLQGAGKPGFTPAVDAIRRHPLRARLARIACPTLIVWGTNDWLIPLRDAYEFERLVPGAQLLVYGDTGHVAMLERPAHFNEAVARFLGRDASAAERHNGASATKSA